ncbi:MFS transporter [Methylobacterium sp. WSM2598]|uniref:MFS transporter n=1 Tax=Methylobacterium sp. WSM2598 TaxID=398261 RepID=UPI0003607ACB|nr:MFS transporter [Methylobacterium sp. WSM2598]
MQVRLGRPLAILGATQVIGWGSILLPPVIGARMGASLGLDLPTVLAGSSLVMVVSGLASPLLGRAYARIGARSVMMAGSLLGAAGLLLLSAAAGLASYLLAWAVLGLFGAAMLSTSANAYLTELAGPRARSAIGLVMLVTGLATGIFWPLTAWLDAAIGWRGAVRLYAGLQLALVLPLLAWLPPARGPVPATAAAPAPSAADSPFRLMAAAIGLSGFVSFGLEAVTIALLTAYGFGTAEAVAAGSAMGLLKVAGRMIDMAGGARWDGLTTGIVATGAMPLGLAALLLGGGGSAAALVFAVLFGLGSGAFAIARATMPLVFYDGAAYGAALARIALPLNLAAAAAPPLLGALLTRFGPAPALATAMGCSLAACALLARLARLRPAR